MIEAVIGFSVVLDPKHSAYVSTTRMPCVVFERMSKEEVAVADNALRLLETMAIDVSFRKILTRQSCLLCHVLCVAIHNSIFNHNIITTLLLLFVFITIYLYLL